MTDGFAAGHEWVFEDFAGDGFVGEQQTVVAGGDGAGDGSDEYVVGVGGVVGAGLQFELVGFLQYDGLCLSFHGWFGWSVGWSVFGGAAPGWVWVRLLVGVKDTTRGGENETDGGVVGGGVPGEGVAVE